MYVPYCARLVVPKYDHTIYNQSLGSVQMTRMNDCGRDEGEPFEGKRDSREQTANKRSQTNKAACARTERVRDDSKVSGYASPY